MTTKGNFGFIAIVTTLLVTIMLSSCSHDKYLYSEEKVEQNLTKSMLQLLKKRLVRLVPMLTGDSAARKPTHAPLPVLRALMPTTKATYSPPSHFQQTVMPEIS